jgi:hypothetical protein
MLQQSLWERSFTTRVEKVKVYAGKDRNYITALKSIALKKACAG